MTGRASRAPRHNVYVLKEKVQVSSYKEVMELAMDREDIEGFINMSMALKKLEKNLTSRCQGPDPCVLNIVTSFRRLYFFIRFRAMTKSALWYGVLPGGACGMFDPIFTKPYNKTDVSDFSFAYNYEFICFLG